MSDENQNCPKCSSPHGYNDGSLWVCPECFFEWVPSENSPQPASVQGETAKFLDANGVQLADGDTVVTIKDLKLGKETLKSGTKVKNIRLLDEPVDGHDISCKVADHGSLYLKCSVVKKAK